MGNPLCNKMSELENSIIKSHNNSVIHNSVIHSSYKNKSSTAGMCIAENDNSKQNINDTEE